MNPDKLELLSRRVLNTLMYRKKESYRTGNTDPSYAHPLRSLRVLLVHVKGTSSHAKRRTETLVL